jgi:Fe-S-cluster containining protein
MTTTKRRLPILVEESVGSVQALRTDMAVKFEMVVRDEVARTRKTISCTPGCSSCCYHPITISLFEGVLIYRWLVRHNKWTLKLQQRLQEVSEMQHGQSYEVWLFALIPCPLLQDNRCSAYEARPFICRAYYATSDPYYCHPHRLGPDTKIIPRQSVVERYHEEQAKILREHKLQFLTMPIGTAVLLGEKLCKGLIELDEVDQFLMKEYVDKL